MLDIDTDAIEGQVRGHNRLGDDLARVDLMNQAFGQGGPLAEPNAVPGETNGRQELFASACAVLQDPARQREINYDDSVQSAEAVTVANLLMRAFESIQESGRSEYGITRTAPQGSLHSAAFG